MEPDCPTVKAVERTLIRVPWTITTVISGGARGADKLGERWAYHNKVEIRKFIPDWDELGKKAGFIRNEKMADVAECLVAFWNGSSSGTRHMINTALNRKLDVLVINYNRLGV